MRPPVMGMQPAHLTWIGLLPADGPQRCGHPNCESAATAMAEEHLTIRRCDGHRYPVVIGTSPSRSGTFTEAVPAE